MIEFTSRTPIEKGWSGNRKYMAVGKDGGKYLLRLADLAKYEQKKSKFDTAQRLAALGVPMCRPADFGVCDEGVYIIYEWIDGVDAEEALPGLSMAKQHEYGWEAGRILKLIHSIPAPEGCEDWQSRFNRKIDRKLAQYAECPLKYENGQAFIDYIESNRHLLAGRPQTCQHGDYHIGNMMMEKGGRLVIIDFDRDDYGDPWEEFNRIVWCAQKSPVFAKGLVDGYFDGCPPEDFWKLLALYISSNTLSSLPWAMPFGQDEVDVMKRQAEEVLSWYNNMEQTVPGWYLGR